MKTHTLKNAIISIVIGIFVAGIVILLSNSERFKELEAISVDLRFLIRGVEKPSDKVIIVTWDDESFTELKRRYQDWPRSFHAQVITNLKDYGAKVIGFDIFVEDPAISIEENIFQGITEKLQEYIKDANTREKIIADLRTFQSIEDILLAQATKYAGNVIYDSRFAWVSDEFGTREQMYIPISLILENGGDFGFVNIPIDADGFARNNMLAKKFSGDMFYSSSIKIVARYLGVKDSEIKYAKNKISIGKKIEIPVDERNYMPINFRGGIRTFETVSYHKVLRGTVKDKDIFKNKIVLVGIYSDTVPDIHYTPFSRFDKIKMPGIEVIANTIDTILTKDFLKIASAGFNNTIIILLGMIIGFLSYRFGFIQGIAVSFVLAILFSFFAIYLFTDKNIIINLFSPLLTIFLTYGGVTVFRGLTEEKEKKKIKSIFSRYVTQQVVNEILSSPEGMALGGKRKECTILFSDIRGFTSMSENMQPEEVVHVLNEYMEKMVDVVFKYQGTLDKFIGDAIMAIWGAPIAHPDDTKRAVFCALEMLSELKKLQEKWADEGRNPFDIGIGINVGEVVVGNIGHPERMEYTAIGDNVNLASRLENLNKEFKTHIIISQKVYEKVADFVEVRPLEPVQVKGKAEKVMIYEVLGRK